MVGADTAFTGVMRKSTSAGAGAPMPPGAPTADVPVPAERLDLVTIPRSCQPDAAAFDERRRFVGSSLRDEAATDFAIPPADGWPLVFVSLGAVALDKPVFSRAALEAFFAFSDFFLASASAFFSLPSLMAAARAALRASGRWLRRSLITSREAPTIARWCLTVRRVRFLATSCWRGR